MKAMINLLKNEHKVDGNTPMTPELIEEFFKTPSEYQNVDLAVKKNALIPTRKYFGKYADHMRLLTNEHNSTNFGIRRGYRREVQSELREQGIDVRDSGLTPQIIRDSLWNREFADLTKSHVEQVQSYLINDEKT